MSVWEERESDLEAQLNRGTLWAVTYGDLMSYLVIFFLILYASVSSRSVAMQLGLQGVEEQFGKESNVVTELFSKYGVQQIAKLEVGEDKMRILFYNPVLFDIGSATLKPTALPHLKRLVVALSELPNAIQIEGHTDNIPPGRRMQFKTNWELSSARAFEVLRYFEKTGIPPSRLSAIGYGEYRPLESNDTAKGRGANRRIEVNIMRRRE